ncbi:MAG: hypothetical protein FWF44_01550 [Defluviitaleaceae bacterium]|nr:hypothetical protein [Defluviitaleaceae bacterium]
MGAVIVNFSGRIGDGNGSAIGEFIRRNIFSGGAELINFNSVSVHPCTGCGYECFYDHDSCRYAGDDAVRIYEAVADAEMAVFIVPSYCDFPCSNYFAFKERAQCFCWSEKWQAYLDTRKKFVVIANSGFETISDVIKHGFSKVTDDDILLLRCLDYGSVSIKGNLMENERAGERIREFFDTL